MAMKLVLATGNRGKIREIRSILSDLDIEILSADDFESFPDPEETGKTFLENALIKAKAVHAATSLPALADDSGIEVDCLGGAPGIESARYGGSGLSDKDRYLRLLDEMRGVPEGERGARFRCVMVLYPAETLKARPPKGGDGRILGGLKAVESAGYHPEGGAKGHRAAAVEGGALVTEGFLYGTIAREPAGDSGFGYDPVFLIPEKGRTAAQLTAEEKNAISHRYRALQEMKNILSGCGGADYQGNPKPGAGS